MEAHCKVIPFKNFSKQTATYDVLSERLNAGPIDGRESDSLINKALCVLKEDGGRGIGLHFSTGIRIRYICLPTIWVAWQGLR